jgi:hypothetical protein
MPYEFCGLTPRGGRVFAVTRDGDRVGRGFAMLGSIQMKGIELIDVRIIQAIEFLADAIL